MSFLFRSTAADDAELPSPLDVRVLDALQFEDTDVRGKRGFNIAPDGRYKKTNKQASPIYTIKPPIPGAHVARRSHRYPVRMERARAAELLGGC